MSGDLDTDEMSDVPWSAVERTRDRLVHHYLDIDLDVLCATVTEVLPTLLNVLPNLDA